MISSLKIDFGNVRRKIHAHHIPEVKKPRVLHSICLMRISSQSTNWRRRMLCKKQSCCLIPFVFSEEIRKNDMEALYHSTTLTFSRGLRPRVEGACVRGCVAIVT